MARTGLGKLLQRALGTHLAAHPALPTREGLTRRHVLAGLSAVGVSLTLPARGRALTGSPSIAVLGAGLAGLVAARDLVAAGADVTVYEARQSAGGRVRSTAAPFAPDLVLDLGGAFINTDHAEMIALAESLGIELFARATVAPEDVPQDAFYFGGAWRSEAAFAVYLTPLADRIAADIEALDASWKTTAPRIDALSVADYLNDALPKGTPDWARALVEATIRSEYGVEPAEASGLEILWLGLEAGDGTMIPLGNSDEAFVVMGGSGRIPQALAAALGDRMRYGRSVTTIEDRETAGVALGFADGSTGEHDAAVIALPLPPLRRVAITANLPEGFRALLAEGRLGRNEKLFAGFRGRPWLADQRFAEEVWTDLGASVVWDASVRQFDVPDAALTFFQGGAEVDAMNDGATPAELLADRLAGLGPAVPALTQSALAAEPLRTDWARSPETGGGYTSFAPGQYTRFAEFLWFEDDEVSGPAYGNLVFAGEHLSDAYYGFMNGAAETGRMAAENLISRF